MRKILSTIIICLIASNGFSQGLKSTLASGTTFYNTYETFNWNVGNAEWDNSTITYYTRNSNGTESIKLTNVWDGANGVFMNSTKETYTYTSGGKISIYLYQTWSTVDGILDWTNNTRTVYTYNASSLVSTVTDYTWKLVNGKYTWANVSKHSYTYNAQSLKSEDRYSTGKQDTLWDDISKTLFVYDTKKNNTELTYQL